MLFSGGLPLLAFLAGCIQVEETITLNADGSGIMELSYSVADQQAVMLESAIIADEQLDAGDDFSFSADAIRRQFDEMDFEGVELIQADSSVKDGRRNISMAVKFESLDALSETPLMSERRVALQKGGDGRFTFTQRAGASAISSQAGAEMPAMVQSMFQGLKVQICVKTPGRIVSSNASETDGREARWIYDISNDSNAFARIQNMDVQVSFEADSRENHGTE